MVIMEYVDLGLKIPATILFTILEKVLMLMGEVGIGLISVNIPPITQVSMVDFFVYLFLLVMFIKLFMEMEEVIVSLVI